MSDNNNIVYTALRSIFQNEDNEQSESSFKVGDIVILQHKKIASFKSKIDEINCSSDGMEYYFLREIGGPLTIVYHGNDDDGKLVKVVGGK